MSDNEILRLLEVVRRNPKCRTARPATAQDVRDFTWGRLPPAYRALVSEFGYIRMDSGAVLLGLGPDTAEDPERSMAAQMTWVYTHSGNAQFGPGIYPIMRHGPRSFFCIHSNLAFYAKDTPEPKPKTGQPSVIVWDYKHPDEILQAYDPGRQVSAELLPWLLEVVDPDGSVRKAVDAGPLPKPRRAAAAPPAVAAAAAPDVLPPGAGIDRVVAALRARGGCVVGGGCTEEQLSAAEAKLGVELPANYRRFVLAVGSAEVGGSIVLGLGKLAGPAVEHDTLKVTLRERKPNALLPLPRDLVAISDMGNGDWFCLQTSKTKGDDCPVVHWTHELDASQTPDRLAPSFRRWLIELYNEAPLE